MIDWLVGGLLVRSVMQELATEGAKEYGKEFFKNSLGKVLHLPEKDVQKEACKRALEEFVELFVQQLEMADLDDDKIKDYGKPLKIFIKDDKVESILGDPFDIACQLLDTSTLATSWQTLELKLLPSEFNWEKLGKFYLRKVRGIIENDDKLKGIFLVKIQEQKSENIKEIAGIKTDYDLDKYAEGLKAEYGHLKLECLDTTTYEQIKLWRMFVPQNAKPCKQFIAQLYEYPIEVRQELLDKGVITQAEFDFIEQELKRKREEYFSEKSALVLDLIKSPKNRKIVFLGDPGAGKSSLLQYLALNWAEKDPNSRAMLPIPLLIELRTYARDKEENRCQDFLEFFHEGNLFCHLNQHDLHSKLNRGQAIALFDGLDEVFEPRLRERIITDIKRFSLDYPNVQIIVTSRWLGYKAEELTHANFKHFMLQDLDQGQIADFIQRWHDLAFQNREDKTFKQQRLEKAIKESKAIGQLAGNPLLLTMMAILNRTQELPRDRPKLYERASEVLLHQWDFETKEGLIDPELQKYLYDIDLRDKTNILRLVANAMQEGEKGLGANLIYKEELEGILRNYLEKTGINQRDAQDLTDLIIKQLRYRNFILCSLGGNVFAFVHRTFLEYFCACEFYERFKNRGLAGGITLEELKIDVFGKHCLEDSWKEVLCLLTGMLSADFPPEIPEELINYLIDRGRKNTGFKALFFAVDCFLELRNPSTHVEINEQLFNSLKLLIIQLPIYQNIFKGDKELSRVDLKRFFFIDDTIHEYSLPKIVAENAKRYKSVEQLSKLARFNTKALSYLQDITKQGDLFAIDVLVEDWLDHPQTLPLIQQLANEGKSRAISNLAKYWQDDAQTLSIIQQQAHNVEWSAIDALKKYWGDNSQTLPIIQKQANLPIIQEQAQNDQWRVLLNR